MWEGVSVGVNVMFKANPGDEGGAEGEIKEAFVRDGKDDEGWSEGQEDDDETVEVVTVGS